MKLPRSEETIEMKLGVLVPVAMALGITLAAAQNPIKRTDLQQVDQPEGYTTSMMIVEIAPNHSVPPHFHPGPEEMTITFPGKPPVTLKKGDSLTFPANAVHQGTMGPAGVKLLRHTEGEADHFASISIAWRAGGWLRSDRSGSGSTKLKVSTRSPVLPQLPTREPRIRCQGDCSEVSNFARTPHWKPANVMYGQAVFRP